MNGKPVFQNRYAFSSLIICGEHEEEVRFRRVAGAKRENRPTWACQEYVNKGIKACCSPILVENELYIIMKDIIKKYINNKSEIIDDLLKRYEDVNIQQNYEKEIKCLESKIKEIKQKKDKLLELVVNGHIENNEFALRNEDYNEEIRVV